MTVPAEDKPPFPGIGVASHTTFLLVLAVLAAFMSRQVMYLLTQPLKVSFGVTDSEIGALLGPAYVICAWLASIPLARLVDRGSRKRVLLGCIVGWSVFTAATGYCTDFWQLYVCRAGVGISEAVLIPSAFSILADVFRPAQRSGATLLFFGAILLAGNAGVAGAGALINFLDGHAGYLPAGFAGVDTWRLTLRVIGASGLLVALLFTTMREPARQERAGAHAEARADGLKAYLQANWVTLTLMYLGLVTTAVVSDTLFGWLPTIMVREFGSSPGSAGIQVSICAAVGSLSGLAGAYIIHRRLVRRWGGQATLRMAAIAGAATVPCFFLVPHLAGPSMAMGVLITCMAISYTGAGLVPALIVSVAPNHLRAQVYALYTMTATAGNAIAPFVTGTLSDRFQEPDGLSKAVTFFCIGSGVLGALLLSLADRPLARTYRRLAAARPEATPIR